VASDMVEDESSEPHAATTKPDSASATPSVAVAERDESALITVAAFRVGRPDRGTHFLNAR
jgi:hypothetical protein